MCFFNLLVRLLNFFADFDDLVRMLHHLLIEVRAFFFVFFLSGLTGHVIG